MIERIGEATKMDFSCDRCGIQLPTAGVLCKRCDEYLDEKYGANDKQGKPKRSKGLLKKGRAREG